MKKMKKVLSLFLSIVLLITTVGIVNINAATDGTRYSKKYLQNGGFEENVEKYTFSSYYTQPQKIVVPYWDTTAYNTTGSNGKMEFFKKGAAHFNLSSIATNKDVAEGEVAAELNADEVSTIYQRIETVSGSTYTWGLDHRGRDTTDTMVLFIGPEQYKTVDGVQTAIDPSKPSKAGQDQFVKMTEWLKTQYGISYPTKGCSQKYTIYSKPFDKNGKFQNESKNADENFSMTETAECNQEWNLWVISSENENKDPDPTKAVKGWSKYGTNCYNENEDSYNDVINGADSKLGYDCTYTVPKGQTKTLFAFTSYSSGRKSGNEIVKEPTFGNLLDDINFKLYQPISSSITEGGTGGVQSGNATITNDLQNGNLFYSTVNDGNECTIHTKLTDGKSGHVFQGAYVTVFDDAGNPITKFVDVYPGDTSGLTEDEKLELSKTYFMPDDYYQHEGGEKWDYFYTVKVDSPVHIHMMYTKAPFILYDSNGGVPYQWTEDNSVGGNLVGFRDGFKGLEGVNSEGYYEDVKVEEIDNGDGTYTEKITPGKYISHVALPDENWQKNSFGVSSKFLGWAITDTNNKQVILDGVHTATYAPDTNGVGNIEFTDASNHNVTGLILDATHGVTLTAQWKFGYTAQAQTLLGHALETQKYENSDVGGWVEETFINDRSNVTDHKDLYTQNRTERTDAYGSVGEKIIFRAVPDSANNYVFDGWYIIDKNGTETCITTTPNLAITVEEGKSTTYYARFKTKTVPVVFHYSESGASDGYDYYLRDADNRYGKYFQEVVYNEKATQPPTNLNPKVTMWFTSPTERDQDHLFNFNTAIKEVTHLYASPAFTFNYFNVFPFEQPWKIDTYATLKFNGSYIDLKNDADVSDYNIYIKKGSAVNESAPSYADMKQSKNIKAGKKVNSANVIFNQTTNTGKTFNRAGVRYTDMEISSMNIPIWVLFDFTYKGITYTSAIKNRSLWNNIDTYQKTMNEEFYSSYPAETATELRAAQDKLMDEMKKLCTSTAETLVSPSSVYDGVSVANLDYVEESESNYTFTSTTAIRNIEPWGLKYSFNVENHDVANNFEDFGAVIFTDFASAYSADTITVQDVLNNESSVMYSKSNDNVYGGENGAIEICYVNNMTTENFDKNTYAVFFVKDENGYHYSNVVANSYNSLATLENTETSNAILDYAEALNSYKQALEDAKNQNPTV